MFPADGLVVSRLSGGPQLVTEPIDSVESVSVGLWVPCGSCDEDHSTSGLSHFLEHMTFKGTETRSAEQISREADFIGAEMNAFTEREYTCYFTRVLPQYLPEAIDILCDIVLHPTLDADELERERQVVIQEIRQADDNPPDLAAELLANLMFRDHPLGRPVLGREEVIQKLSREDVLNFYKRHYRPDKMLITTSGNLDYAAFERQLEQIFAGAPSGNNLPSQQRGKPNYHNGRVTKYKDVEQDYLFLGFPGVTQSSPERHAMSLIDAALGGGSSSRLFVEIREKRGLAYSVSSFGVSMRDAGVFGVHFVTSPDNLEEALAVTRRELEKIRKYGLDDVELQKVKNQARGSILMSLETTSMRMFLLGRSIIYLDRVMSTDEVLSEIDRVDAAAIKEVANQMLHPEGEAMALVGPVVEESLVGATSQREPALQVGARAPARYGENK